MTNRAGEKQVYSIVEAARLVRVCPKTIRRWIKSGKLEAAKGADHCDAYRISNQALLEATKDDPGAVLRNQQAAAEHN